MPAVLSWFLLAALLILPVLLRLYAEDHPRDRGDQDDGDREPERAADVRLAA